MTDLKSGSVKITHSSMVIFWRPGKELGEVEFLAFQYTRKKNGQPWTTWRFPTETVEEGVDETPLDTAISGMHQEIPRDPNDFHFEFENSGKPIWVKKCSGDSDRGGGIHEKHVFLAHIKHGELRTTVFEEPAKKDIKTGAERPPEVIGPPCWYGASPQLLGMMHERGLPFHREALIKGLSFLARDKAIANRYGRILESFQSS